MNLHYAKFVNGQLTYTPSIIVTKRGDTILNPKRLSYLQAGYKQLVDDPPVPPRGKSAALTRYDETSDTITAVYKFVPASTAPRTFSKLRLVAALDAQGLWQAFRDWLIESDYYDLFLAAPKTSAKITRPSAKSSTRQKRASISPTIKPPRSSPPPSPIRDSSPRGRAASMRPSLFLHFSISTRPFPCAPTLTHPRNKRGSLRPTRQSTRQK